MAKKVLFVINRYSGAGYHFPIENRIRETCARNKAECVIEYTKHRGHAVSLAKDASSEGYDHVVAVGGDGTINEVAQGVLDSGTSMAILPRGSGNGLAKHFGIPAHLPDAVDNLFNSTVIHMDTILINERLSLNVSGIGFDGHVANLFANKKIRGLFGYARLTIRELFEFKDFESEVTIDGSTLSVKAFIIAVANSSQYGNNIKIAPDASVRDGLFDVTVMKKVSVFNISFIYSFLKGELKKSDECQMWSGKEARVKTSERVPYHIDGEPCGLEDTFTFRVRPASLPILVPNQFVK